MESYKSHETKTLRIQATYQAKLFLGFPSGTTVDTSDKSIERENSMKEKIDPLDLYTRFDHYRILVNLL